MPSGKHKGNAFEREICKVLSLWWSDGEDDAVFWRGDSGARAMRRGRAGTKTANQHSDIIAVQPCGQPLVDLLTIEIKRGYSKFSVQDVLDKEDKAAQQVWEKWYSQVLESCKYAGSASWMIISRRDRRQALVFFPRGVLELLPVINTTPTPSTWFSFIAFLRTDSGDRIQEHIVGMLLDDWLSTVKAEHIRKAMRR